MTKPFLAFTLFALAPFGASLRAATASENLMRWTLKLDDTAPAGASGEIGALRDASKAEAPRLVDRIDGVEVWARELGDGRQVVGVFNKSGLKPAYDFSRAAYDSPVVTHKTPGGAIDIDLPLDGARKLYLVVGDAGDGNSNDHADWIEPHVTGPSGDIRLTDLKWTAASTGWGKIVSGRSAGGQALRVGSRKPAYGLGVHADSVIAYDLPAGCTRFRCSAGLDNSADGRGSVKFSVFTVDPHQASTGRDTVRIVLSDLNYAVPCEVRNLATGAGEPRAEGTLSVSLPVGEATVHLLTPTKPAPRTSIRSGEIWSDTEGRVIQAHGGGMLFHEGVYYWYGEYKNAMNSGGGRVDVIGVSCYSSRDLLNWKFEGLALKGDKEPGHDLSPERVLERPKVVYNAKTKKFVMWAHIDSANYAYARGGVAVSDSPAGPFTYLGSVRPEGTMCRDMTVFLDDDGSAYHIYASDENATTRISKLSDDYTKHTGVFADAFKKKYLEAASVFKREGRYYMIASGQSGWSPNPAHSATAGSMLGNWVELGDPCHGEKSRTTYDSQSTYVIRIEGLKDTYILMADRWRPDNLRDSRYVWLPLRFEDGKPKIDWNPDWSPSKL